MWSSSTSHTNQTKVRETQVHLGHRTPNRPTVSMHHPPSQTPSVHLSHPLQHAPSPSRRSRSLPLPLTLTHTCILGPSPGRAHSHMHARTTQKHGGKERHTRTHVLFSLFRSSCSPPSRSLLLTHDFSTLSCLSFLPPALSRIANPLSLNVVLFRLVAAPSSPFAFTWKHGLGCASCFRLQGCPSTNLPLFHMCPLLSRCRCLSISTSRKSSFSRSLSIGGNVPPVLELSNSRPCGSVRIDPLFLTCVKPIFGAPSRQRRGTRMVKMRCSFRKTKSIGISFKHTTNIASCSFLRGRAFRRGSFQMERSIQWGIDVYFSRTTQASAKPHGSLATFASACLIIKAK